MKGVELILERLLGLSFVAEEPGTGEVWHSSVQKYTVREGKRVLGILYLDPFMRPGKALGVSFLDSQRKGGCCFVNPVPYNGKGVPPAYRPRHFWKD